MPGFIGFPELIVLALVLLLIFGPKRLPEVGKSLGRGIRDFKDGITGVGGDDDEKPEKPRELPAAAAPEASEADAEEPADKSASV